MKQPDSRGKFIAIIVAIFKSTGYSLEQTAAKCRVSMGRFLKWMANSPDLSKAMGESMAPKDAETPSV